MLIIYMVRDTAFGYTRIVFLIYYIVVVFWKFMLELENLIGHQCNYWYSLSWKTSRCASN